VIALHEDGRLEHLTDEVIAGLKVGLDAFLLVFGRGAFTPRPKVEAVSEGDAQRGLPSADMNGEGFFSLFADVMPVIVPGGYPSDDAQLLFR
jgi:hypothetical protein